MNSVIAPGAPTDHTSPVNTLNLFGSFDPMKTTVDHTLINRLLASLRKVQWPSLALALAIALVSAGCQSSNLAGAPAYPPSSTTKSLDPGDTLRLNFPGAREYDQVQKIRSDGRISLPIVGEVKAAGKKVGELQAQLTRLYKEQLQNSEVVVSLDAPAAVVYVTGAVGKPSRVVLDRPMTAFEAIMEAGGFQAGLANLKKVTLIRSEHGKHKTFKLDVNSTITQSSSEAIYLKPYDVIHVGERFF